MGNLAAKMWYESQTEVLQSVKIVQGSRVNCHINPKYPLRNKESLFRANNEYHNTCQGITLIKEISSSPLWELALKKGLKIRKGNTWKSIDQNCKWSEKKRKKNILAWWSAMYSLVLIETMRKCFVTCQLKYTTVAKKSPKGRESFSTLFKTLNRGFSYTARQKAS